MSKTLILCDCLGSQPINKDEISNACQMTCSRLYTNLCGTQVEDAAAEISTGNSVIACQQEQALFTELADEVGAPAPDFIDIRDRAGWSDEAAQSAPKMAALISDSMLPQPALKTVDVTSEGQCLIIGSAEVALPVAEQLSEGLSVTALLNDTSEIPMNRDFDFIVGHIKSVRGTFGNFAFVVDGLQQLVSGGRGMFEMTPPVDGGQSNCDIILDLSGNQALFPAPQKRDGYLKADPRDPNAVAKATFDAAQMVGTFEKPFYIKVEDHLCAHSRAEITGCTKCLDICPTGAILPDGEHVKVDPMVCAGCGACASLCPSGAITYDVPPTAFIFKRIQNLAERFKAAGGSAPRLLVHDAEFGGEMISLLARFGRGLPADVIPLEVGALSGFGHAEMLAALGCGFVHVDVLLAPKTEPETPNFEVELARTITGNDNIRLLDMNDPDALGDALYNYEATSVTTNTILPQGSRRQVTRLAASALLTSHDAPIPLPVHAPYGAVLVDTDACTLCLSCAALCPTGALADNPDMPQLRFQEDACLQCGLCTRVCPENAITLVPQLDLSDRALTQTVLHEEEPFACIECGALFGVKSTIEKITEKLAGKHEMFKTSDTARLIQMCDKCRVEVQFSNTDNPFLGGDRPRTVTTEDYLSKRRDH